MSRQQYRADRIKGQVLRSLRKLGEKVITDLERGRFPRLEIPARTTSNIVYDESLRQYVLGSKVMERTAKNIRHLRPFAQLLWIATFAKQLIQRGKTSTLRDTYYVAIGEGIDFEDQAESDEMIMQLESILDFPREDFHIFPEERASIFGDLVI
ncbi:MAG TPA: DNA topoisomerase IV subunit A, partial [Nitrososphaeria archaeon]|nr:DNA topoisomerase IV subunit A [Nitrososphaeria archaeon]